MVAARFADSGKGPARRNSRRQLVSSDKKEPGGCSEDFASASESFNNSEKEEDKGDKDRPRYTKQYSFTSTEEDRAIAEAVSDEVSTHRRASHKTQVIDEPTRTIERRGSDSSVDHSVANKSERRKAKGRGLRRTTSDELQQFEFAERAEKAERVSESTSLDSGKSNQNKKSKAKKSLTFLEDPNAKHGVSCQYLEGSSPLTAEEKTAAWYGGRNYKLFKSLCYSESVEAKENEDYCMRFDKVWAACATVSVDFAWQELMKAEHKKTSPNNAVMLAKARCRGFEREIFPETLLRNRLATVKYVVRSYKQAEASITMSPEEREESVRDASIRCSRPFRRFARLIAEGDSLLVAAWERVKRQDESGEEDVGIASGNRRDLMSAARSSGRRESRRDMMQSLKNSGSARKLLSMQPQNQSRRNLLATGRQESRRDMLMSLKSSGSCRKLMSGMPDYNREQSRRDLMSSLYSSGSTRRLLSRGFDATQDDAGEEFTTDDTQSRTSKLTRRGSRRNLRN